MLALFAALALLGFLAIDPIGIAAMPILLLQNRPFSRSLSFLSGSFASLVIIGFLIARYIGQILLKLDNAHAWVVPVIEFIAGLILIVTALFLFIKRESESLKLSTRSESVRKKLQMNNKKLFILGALIVLAQSLIDVIFVLAMIRVGELKLTNLDLSFAVAIYALSSLAIQFIIVAAFALTPLKHRARTLVKVHKLLDSYSNQIITVVSLVLGIFLIIVSTLKV